MELPSQSGLTSPKYTDSEDDEAMTRAQMRKNNKPLLEKKRRARINSSLEQLKSLVLDALKKDSARYSKLEKADILEMTVKHLRELQRQQMAAAMTIDPTVMAKYQNGFGECAQEVQRYLGSIDGLSSEVRVRLMHHLSNCMNQVQKVPSYGCVPVYAGVPCASPSQTLPGLGVRPLLPFGGLAMTSSDCPGLRMSPSSGYNCADHSLSDGAFSPKCKPCEARSPASLDNRENIEPCGMLLDCYRLDLAAQCPADDDNNNLVCLPPTKRRKVEAQRDPCGHQDRNQQNANNHIGPNLFDVVKSESVWRPW